MISRSKWKNDNLASLSNLSKRYAANLLLRTDRLTVAQEDLLPLPLHVRDCLEVFCKDWIVIKHNYERFSLKVRI